MKKILLSLSMLIAMSVSFSLVAQNLLPEGNMESQGSWDTVWVMGTQTHATEFNFGFGSIVPSEGEGNCLEIFSETNDGDPLFNNDIILFHPMTVAPGTTYKMSGAYADFTSAGVSNFWCEIGYSIYNPKDSIKAGVTFLMAMNTWDGCGALFDGTFEEASCKYYKVEGNDTIVYPYFHVPDTLDGDQTYYFVLEVGTWNNAGTALSYDIGIDEVMIVDSATSTSNILAPEIINTVEINNYPNPVEQSTTINYSIPQSGNVELSVYNILGQKVETLVNNFVVEGSHEVVFDATELTGSLYFYTMRYNGKIYTNKLIVY